MSELARQAPLADTLRRLMSLTPAAGLGLAELADPKMRRPPGTETMRRWQIEVSQLGQIQAEIVRLASDRLVESGQRLAAARDPAQALIAQTGMALAFAELATAPLRAWLDALPKLHACCLEQNDSAGDGSRAEPAPQKPDQPPERAASVGTSTENAAS